MDHTVSPVHPGTRRACAQVTLIHAALPIELARGAIRQQDVHFGELDDDTEGSEAPDRGLDLACGGGRPAQDRQGDVGLEADAVERDAGTEQIGDQTEEAPASVRDARRRTR